MAWYLTTDEAEAREASKDEIFDAVGNLRDGGGEFFVVEPEPGSESMFIQASVWTEGVALGASYVAEVRVPDGGSFRQWRLRTRRPDEISEAVRAFVSGGDPVGPRWAEVTDEFTDS